MVGERAHADAWKAAIEAAGPPAFDFGDAAVAETVAPKDLPPIYVLIALEQRSGSPVRFCGSRPVYGWRLTTRVVGRTVDEARWARERVSSGLADKRLATVGATPLTLEAEDAIAPDEGRFSGPTTWVYAAPV